MVDDWHRWSMIDDVVGGRCAWVLFPIRSQYSYCLKSYSNWTLMSYCLDLMFPSSFWFWHQTRVTTFFTSLKIHCKNVRNRTVWHPAVTVVLPREERALVDTLAKRKGVADVLSLLVEYAYGRDLASTRRSSLIVQRWLVLEQHKKNNEQNWQSWLLMLHYSVP